LNKIIKKPRKNHEQKKENINKYLFEVFFKEYQKWGDDFIVPISQQNLYDWKAVDFLDKLINNH